MMHFFEIKVLKVRHVDYIVFINQCAACSMLVGKPYIVSKSFSFGPIKLGFGNAFGDFSHFVFYFFQVVWQVFNAFFLISYLINDITS